MLITRPLAQIAVLKELVEARQGVAYVFSTLEIRYASADSLKPQLEAIKAGNILVFVSMNAVEGVFRNIDDKLRQRLSHTKIAAVGKRTLAALEKYNMPVAIAPDAGQQHSEGLLQHPLLENIADQSIIIVRAQSGREYLRNSLLERGGKVGYISAYHRDIPAQYDVEPIIKALKASQIQIVLATSYAAFANLKSMIGASSMRVLKDLFANTEIIVPSERIAEKIRETSSLSVHVAENASDSAMLDKAAEP